MSDTLIHLTAEFFTRLRERLAEAIATENVRYNRDSHAQESIYLWTDKYCLIHLVHQAYDPQGIDDPPQDGFPQLTFSHQDDYECYHAQEASINTTTGLAWRSDGIPPLTTGEIFELILSTYKQQAARDPATIDSLV